MTRTLEFSAASSVCFAFCCAIHRCERFARVELKRITLRAFILSEFNERKKNSIFQTMARLTKELMKRALTQHKIEFSVRANAPELLQLYRTIAEEHRRAFEATHGIETIADGDNTAEPIVENEPPINNIVPPIEVINPQPNQNNVVPPIAVSNPPPIIEDVFSESSVADDFDEIDTSIDLDAEIAKLRKEREILMLREEIRRLKERQTVVISASQLASAVNSAEQLAPPMPPSAPRPMQNRPTTTPTIELPDGPRMYAYPPNSSRVGFSLPNGARYPPMKDLPVLPFTGEQENYSARQFFVHLENAMEIIQADDVHRFLCLQNFLRGAARTLLYRNYKNYNDLKAAVIHEFDAHVTPAALEEQFRDRKWKCNAGESLTAYILDMEQYVNVLPAGRLSSIEVLDIIIRNMQLPSHLAALLRPARNNEELKEYVARFKSEIKREMAQANNRSQTTSNSNRRNQTTAATSNTTTAEGDRCYNCSNRGHKREQCPYELRPRDACFKCWQKGHRHNACTNRKRVQRLLTEVAAIQPPGQQNDGNSDEDEAANGLASVNLSE